MLRVYDCITQQHDPPLVLLAVAIAIAGSFTVICLLGHVAAAAFTRPVRRRWLAGVALVAGTAIWAAHFVAMLAFQPGRHIGYATGLTGLSLISAVALSGGGIVLALHRPRRSLQACGGALVGVGLVAAHMFGMSAAEVAGPVSWDAAMLAGSSVLACSFAAASVVTGLAGARRSTWLRAATRLMAATLLVIAISATHSVGTAAASFDLASGGMAAAAGAGGHGSPHPLAINVALASAVILLASLAWMELDRRNAAWRDLHKAMLSDLADIAVEGLLVCDRGRVVATNKSFEQMVGRTADTLQGMQVDTLFDAPEEAAGMQTRLEAVGERVLLSAEGEHIPVEVIDKAILYAGVPHQVMALRDLRERRKSEEAIRFLAHHDALTGLFNRTAFGIALDRQLREYKRNQQPFALLAMDLDRFKTVNDTLGHPVGDLLLQRVADRLRATVRESDVIARLGGDEFAIMLPEPVTPAGIATLARRLVEVVRRPYVVEGSTANIGASIGVVIAPEDGEDANALMRNADLALYRAKHDGRNTARFFESGMDMLMQDRRELELDLRRALIHEELEVTYQPLIDSRSRSVRAFEAMIRWHHPSRGIVPPADFIPLAEEAGLIAQMCNHMLEVATMHAAAWSDDIGVAVNLAAIQFTDGKLLGIVSSALERSGLPAHRLHLEITERIMLKGGGETLAILHELRNLGVRISMEDFGSSSTSFQHLRNFPFDGIKIDSTFVQEMVSHEECAAIVGAVIGLGRRLGITTIVEGVETPEQMLRVQREGCDVVQGKLVGAPVSAEDVPRYLAASRRETA